MINIIINFPNYTINCNGEVYSLKSKKYLIPQNNGNGYFKVGLYNPKYKQIYVHKLVAQFFIPNPNNYKYIDHIDRNKANNHISNLRWVSAKENTNNTAGRPRYAVKRVLHKKYTEEEICFIKQDYKYGAKVMELSRKYNIPRQTISRFVKDVK